MRMNKNVNWLKMSASSRTRFKMISITLLIVGIFVAGIAESYKEPQQERMLKNFIEQSERGVFALEHDINVEERRLTWLPEQGLRGLYLRFGFRPGLLEPLVGLPLYVHGPHMGGEINFFSQTFGYHNRPFILRLEVLFNQILNHTLLRDRVEGFYQQHLARIAHAYYAVYKIFFKEKNRDRIEAIIKKYQQQISEKNTDPKAFGNYPYEEFFEVAHKLEKEGYDGYEAMTAGSFWIRRTIDGTDKDWFRLLKRVLEKIDPWNKQRMDQGLPLFFGE
ncbi:hypothetical protein ACQZV8_03100 [Magnetococcales bacterium HHB-1]